LAQGDSPADQVTPKGINYKNLSKSYFQAQFP
jgi:hypothetical protein